MKQFQNPRGDEPRDHRISSGGRDEARAVRDRECSFQMERRFGTDRRRHASKGHTWISGVGWICRRENPRRDRDPGPFGC